jgi:hypothetical protein
LKILLGFVVENFVVPPWNKLYPIQINTFLTDSPLKFSHITGILALVVFTVAMRVNPLNWRKPLKGIKREKPHGIQTEPSSIVKSGYESVPPRHSKFEIVAADLTTARIVHGISQNHFILGLAYHLPCSDPERFHCSLEAFITGTPQTTD